MTPSAFMQVETPHVYRQRVAGNRRSVGPVTAHFRALVPIHEQECGRGQRSAGFDR